MASAGGDGGGQPIPEVGQSPAEVGAAAMTPGIPIIPHPYQLRIHNYTTPGAGESVIHIHPPQRKKKSAGGDATNSEKYPGGGTLSKPRDLSYTVNNAQSKRLVSSGVNTLHSAGGRGGTVGAAPSKWWWIKTRYCVGRINPGSDVISAFIAFLFVAVVVMLIFITASQILMANCTWSWCVSSQRRVHVLPPFSNRMHEGNEEMEVARDPQTCVYHRLVPQTRNPLMEIYHDCGSQWSAIVEWRRCMLFDMRRYYSASSFASGLATNASQSYYPSSMDERVGVPGVRTKLSLDFMVRFVRYRYRPVATKSSEARRLLEQAGPFIAGRCGKNKEIFTVLMVQAIMADRFCVPVGREVVEQYLRAEDPGYTPVPPSTPLLETGCKIVVFENVGDAGTPNASLVGVDKAVDDSDATDDENIVSKDTVAEIPNPSVTETLLQPDENVIVPKLIKVIASHSGRRERRAARNALGPRNSKRNMLLISILKLSGFRKPWKAGTQLSSRSLGGEPKGDGKDSPLRWIPAADEGAASLLKQELDNTARGKSMPTSVEGVRDYVLNGLAYSTDNLRKTGLDISLENSVVDIAALGAGSNKRVKRSLKLNDTISSNEVAEETVMKMNSTEIEEQTGKSHGEESKEPTSPSSGGKFEKLAGLRVNATDSVEQSRLQSAVEHGVKQSPMESSVEHNLEPTTPEQATEDDAGLISQRASLDHGERQATQTDVNVNDAGQSGLKDSIEHEAEKPGLKNSIEQVLKQSWLTAFIDQAAERSARETDLEHYREKSIAGPIAEDKAEQITDALKHDSETWQKSGVKLDEGQVKQKHALEHHVEQSGLPSGIQPDKEKVKQKDALEHDVEQSGVKTIVKHASEGKATPTASAGGTVEQSTIKTLIVKENTIKAKAENEKEPSVVIISESDAKVGADQRVKTSAKPNIEAKTDVQSLKAGPDGNGVAGSLALKAGMPLDLWSRKSAGHAGSAERALGGSDVITESRRYFLWQGCVWRVWRIQDLPTP